MELVFRKRHFKIPSWLLPVFGYAISIASLIWVLEGVNFHFIAEDFRSMHWGWIALAVASDLGTYIYQAWRWNLLLSPVARVPLWRSVQAIYVGLFTNEVFPLRPGEVIRSYLQARWSALPFSVALSSAIIERIFDGIWLMGAFACAMVMVALPRQVVDVGKGVGAVVAACALCLVLVIFGKRHAHAALPETRWGARLRVLIDDLHRMGRSKSFYAAAAASLPYLLIQVIPIYALMRAYTLDLGWWPALVVLTVLRIGTVIPQAPGNLGASQALMVVALRLFDVDKTTAAGLSLMTWGVITLPLLAAGFIALILAGINLSEIRFHTRSHAAAPVLLAKSQPSRS